MDGYTIMWIVVMVSIPSSCILSLICRDYVMRARAAGTGAGVGLGGGGFGGAGV